MKLIVNESLIENLERLFSSKIKVLVQGITGREGSFHTKLMLEYGTEIVAGVTPGKGGLKVHGVPVYNFIKEALDDYPEINSSIVFVPAKFAKDAILEALHNDLKLIVVITEHIPLHDELIVIRYARLKNITIIGPNTPGIINPWLKFKLGIMPSRIFKQGPIGVISRSGTLAYEVINRLKEKGYGVSTFIGLGGDPIVGLNMIEAVRFLKRDKRTRGIVIIGEIGGTMEERLAEYLMKNPLEKPIIAYIAGKSAPKGKRMGHAGALVYSEKGTAQSKIRLLKRANVLIANTVSDIITLVSNYIS